MCRTLWFLFAYILWISSAGASKYNVSLADLSKCKEYTINNAPYVYREVFDVNTFANNRKAAKELFHLKFIVMSGMSANIMFSEQRPPSANDWIYEFSLGGWQNAFSAYRLKLGANWLWRKPSPNLVGEFDPLPIEIYQSSDGLVSVDIPGNKRFLYYFDKTPLKIRYVAFSAHPDAMYARWFYDCQFDDSIMNWKPPEPTTAAPTTAVDLNSDNPLLTFSIDGNTSASNYYYFLYYNYNNNYMRSPIIN